MRGDFKVVPSGTSEPSHSPAVQSWRRRVDFRESPVFAYIELFYRLNNNKPSRSFLSSCWRCQGTYHAAYPSEKLLQN